MILERIRKALNKSPEQYNDGATLEHCRECDGQCPFIDGTC